MTTSTSLRAIAFGAATATIALGLVALPAVPLLPTQSAQAATAICFNPIDTDYPNLHSGTANEIETGVGAYVEGNFTALLGAQETEGQFVVGGDANFYTHLYSNIGVAGIGSQVSPVSGSDVLVTGGDINIGDGTAPPTTVEVSHLSEGNIVAGGGVNLGVGDTLSFNGAGGQSTGVASPLAPYAAFPSLFNTMSVYFAGQPSTGTVTTDASSVTFDGDGSSDPQIFTVSDGTTLGTIGSPKKFLLTGIPTDAVVIINVTDTTATVSTNQLVSLNGTDVDWSAAYATDPAFSNFTQSLLWNFPSATDVTFGSGSQIPGSIDAPNADVTLLASTNGRLYAGGDVELGDLGGSQSGLEMHNYSFRAYDCSTSDVGSLAITKTLDDPDGVVDPARVFTGTYECYDSTPTLIESGTWSFTIGDPAFVVSNIPVGLECTVAEDALGSPPSADDSSYVWSSPVISGAVIIPLNDEADVTVANEATRLTGSLDVTKSLTDPDAVVAGGRVFSGSYECLDSASNVVATGTWSVTTTGTDSISGLPTGSTCTLTEDLSVAPSSTDPSYVWEAPTFTPASVVVGDGTTVSIDVENTVSSEVGSLSITKTLSDPDAVVTPGHTFAGTYSCAFGSTVVNTGTWAVTTTTTAVINNLSAGATCTLTEDLSTAPSSTDSSYVWEAVVFSPASVVVALNSTVDIEVQNTVRRALGDLEMVKVLDDPFDVVDLSRVYTGTFECSFGGSDVTPAPGTWSTTAGAPAISLATDLPAGTVCTLAEDALTVPPLAGAPQYQWSAPIISPTTVVITDGVVARFTVTNTVFDPFVLANTGMDVALPLLGGVGAVVFGGILTMLGYRRRLATGAARP